MRIVCVGDTHGTTQPVPHGDLFIHVGDLCRKTDLPELAEQAAWITALPHRHKLVIAGNHDWPLAHCARGRRVCRACQTRGLDACDPASRTAALALFDGAYIEDAEIVVDGLRIYATPWQAYYHDWAFNLPDGAVMRGVWNQIPTNLDILVTHVPPRGFGDRIPGGERIGDPALLERVRRAAPRLHVFGHVHHDGGAWRDGTLFANVTTWDDRRAPSVFDFDPTTREITLVDIPSAHFVHESAS